jgi:hypothetical protein
MMEVRDGMLVAQYKGRLAFKRLVHHLFDGYLRTAILFLYSKPVTLNPSQPGY